VLGRIAKRRLPSPAGKGDHVVVDEEVTFLNSSCFSKKFFKVLLSVGL